MPRGRPILLYLPGAEKLAKDTHRALGKAWQLIPFEVRYFTDGELKVFLPNGPENSVRGSDAYLFQVVRPDYPRSRQDIFLEMVMAISTLTECSANFRTAVTPWFAYACQDKRRMRECLTARLAADFLTTAGATNVISVDPHTDGIQAFFDRRQCICNGLYASSLLVQYLDEHFQILKEKEKFAASGVDQGGGNRIKHISKHLGLLPVIPTKIKNYQTGKVEEIIINENVRGRIVVIFDDMVRTGGSIIETAKALIQKGADKIIIAAAHANFCGNAISLLDQLHREGILLKAIFTDSFSYPDSFSREHPWFHQISLAELLAETITNIHEQKSVAHVYLDESDL